MDEKSTEIIKPQDIELSHCSNPYEKPSETPNLESRILPPDINAKEFPVKSPRKIITKPFMPIPKRIVLLSLVLFIIGSSFLMSGLFDYFQGDRERGIAFVVFGSLMFIPGLYYTYQVYLACTAGTPEERQEILEDIPQIDY